MNIPVVRRQIQTVLLIGLALLSTSVVLELASVVRSATDRASTECALVTSSVARQLGLLVSDKPAMSLAAAGRSPQLQQVLDEAIARAPSVLQVAVCDTNGIAAARSLSARNIGRLDSHPPLPEVGNLAQAFAILWDLRDAGRIYQVQTPVVLGDRPFASIRVQVAGTFLRDSVKSTFYKGVVGSLVFVVLVLAGGFALSGVAVARLRALEAGVSAMRAGRFDTEIPESGADEFHRLARELNLLGRQIREERDKLGAGRTLHRAADLLGEGVLTIGPRHEVVLVNASACAWLGIDAASSPGRRLEELLPAEHPLVLLGRRLFASQESPLSVELDPGGSRESLVAVGHRIEDLDDKSPGLLIEIKPSRDQATLHSLIDESRVFSRLGEMAAGVAHELRGPLQSLRFEIDALSSASTQDPAVVEKQARSASEKIQRLDQAISGFLRIARLRPSVVERVGVNDFIGRICDEMSIDANLAGLEFEFRTMPEVPDILADAEILRHAVENLLRNAVQAQPSRDGRVLVHTDHREGWVCVSIVDTGPGIPAQDLEHIFDLFFTSRRDGGSGVGLAVVRQTVELHGGKVEIASEPGSGTRATMLLPPAPGEPGPPAPYHSQKERAQHAP